MRRARARLARALDVRGVVAARLIGSQATNRAGPLSDVDIGVWVARALTVDERAALRTRLTEAAALALGTGEVDVVVLNDASPVLRHGAVRDGVMLAEPDPAERVRMETDALLAYLDTARLRDTLDAGRRRRLAEGRFGRR